MAQRLTYQIGLAHGHAVGYCPETGHVVAEPLRDHAKRLHQRGHIGDDEIGADLYDVLEGLHVGDDLAMEAGYDLVEVGASKKRKAKRKARRAKIKGAIKKTVKAAKNSVKNGLSRAIKATVAIANPAAGLGLMALSKGKKTAKKSAQGNGRATQTLNAATAVTAAKSPQAKRAVVARAGKAGVPKSDVRKTAQALSIAQAAENGDPTAQQLVNTDDAIENANIEPLDPESFPASEPQGEDAPSPASYSDEASDEGGEMPAESEPAAVPDWGDDEGGGEDEE